jgi:hypothetical protein
MRNIKDIIDELVNHPEYLTAEILYKSSVVDQIIETIQDEEEEELYRPSVEKWVNQNEGLVIKNIQDVVCDGYNYASPFYETIETFKEQFLTTIKND